MMQKLVVVGNGMAGVACVEQILKHAPKFEITIFGDETHVNYNRILLSSVLAGEKAADEIVLNGLEWYQKHGIELRLGVRITDVDAERKMVTGDDDSKTPFDKLLIATGSTPLIPPMDGLEKEGLFVFRNLDDARALLDRAAPGKKAVVIGGGLLGLEAARGLQVQGCDVTVVHLMDTLMERQLDFTGGSYLKAKMECLGVKVLLERNTAAILGNGRATGVAFKNGETVEADFVVIAAGIRPSAELGRKAGLHVNRGIVVNDYMETSNPDILAVGECVEHNGICYGKLARVILVGDTSDSHRYMEWLRAQTDLAAMRRQLLFPGPGDDAGLDVAEIADSKIVCGCNGVTKATIIQAVHEKGISTLAQLKDCTRASTGCGSCTEVCQQLLKAVAPEFQEEAKKSLCKCIPFPEGKLREILRSQRLRSVQEVLEIYGNGVGCEVCKPALSYMLDMLWCGDHDEDRSARFINDRVHANIQKDGTFSVVPRIRGGVTSAKELRRIADVAEKYNVRMVKITGSQRIDLLGVKKADLPSIWADLGMPSGQAYTKGVRMVKTCVGTDF